MIPAEDRVRKLLSGFNVYIFDEGEDKSGNITQNQRGQEPSDIDAIAVKDNIFIIMSIYDGTNKNEIDNKIKPFFRRLHYFRSVDQLNLSIANSRTQRGRQSKNYINKLSKYISINNYNYIVRKIFFCPNLIVPPRDLTLESDEFIIDKTLTKYFEYALENINEVHLERELFYFLKIEMRKLRQMVGTRVGNEPELTSNFPTIEIGLENNMKMYSSCVAIRDIIEYCQVLRIANKYNLQAFQRMINGQRLRNISNNYLDRHYSFPNNVILAFNPEIYDPNKSNHYISGSNGNKNIKFYKEFGSLIIIDGQHRLLSHLLNPGRDLDKPILINIILFQDKNKAYDQMAELFLIINTQQSRLVSLVSLKILSKLEPDSIKGMWYRIFNSLNSLNQRDNYLYNKILFEEKEIREVTNKVGISSIITYSGINLMTEGRKIKVRKYIGLKQLAEENITSDFSLFDFYHNFMRKYFYLIGHVSGSTSISARDFGGLLRLIFHFINERRTKSLFKELSKQRRGIPLQLKDSIISFLNKIPFSRLNELEYPSNAWRDMEGFFLGCLRKHYQGFGIGTALSKKGIKAFNKGKKF